MTTIHKAPKKEAAKTTDTKKAQAILQEAAKRPGVCELMEVYGEAQRFQEAAASYRAVLSPEPVEWASSSSAPSHR